VRRPLFALLLLLTLATAASARTAAVLPYPPNEVWSSAVRFIRVDRGYKVREKDEETGYILFDLVEGAKTYKGSLELVRTTDELGRDATRAAFALPDLPRHYETMLLDKLTAKVKDERGTPAAPPPKKPPPSDRPSPDAGGLPRPPTLKELPR
jgi:hypothetical protein